MTDIGSELYRQSQDAGEANFICRKCRFYKGECSCKKGVFIAFESANMTNCWGFEKGQTCPHCGKNF